MTSVTHTRERMKTTHEAVADHNRRVEQVCPVKTMARWDAIKSLFYVAVASSAFWVTQASISDPTEAFAIFMGTLLVIYYGVEINEVEVAGLLTIIFGGNNGDE